MVEGLREKGVYISLSTQDFVSPKKGVSNGINNILCTTKLTKHFGSK